MSFVRTPEIYIAYAPRGAGLRCALAYLEHGADVYGWFTGPRHDAGVAACYFVLEDFHANAQTRYEAVDQAALHSRWSLAEPRRHELAAMQEAFTREWLFHRGEARAAPQLSAYAAAELAAGDINLRFARSVLRHLAGRWPLEYHAEVTEQPHRHTAGPRP